MSKLSAYLVVVFVSIIARLALAQEGTKTVCRIEDGKLVIQINLKWTEEQRRDIIGQFDIDSVVMQNVFKGLSDFTVSGETWRVKRLSASIVELIKSIEDKPKTGIDINDFIHLQFDKSNKPPVAEEAIYGVNRFEEPNIFSYANGVAIFFLPNNRNARRVFISGTFNDWSTMQTPMQPTDSGWVAALRLPPGKYSYKYIVDGKWIHDPANRNKQRNEHGTSNSIVFCYNYQFKLKGRLDARRVRLAGSFNNWNPNELDMIKTRDGWSLPIFLAEGTHAYKFIVDNEWITDPACVDNRPDGRGNVNSYLGIGEKHIFTLKGYAFAGKVYLAGTFNGWNPNEIAMKRIGDGWQIPYILGAGNYEYKYIADGKWLVDPDNPFTTGSGDYTNSFLAHQANYTFVLEKYPEARSVIVTGSFNGWKQDGYHMVKKDGRWVFPICLKPGKYTYKFIVDGQWMLDPGNRLWEENEWGTGNSVLWVER